MKSIEVPTPESAHSRNGRFRNLHGFRISTPMKGENSLIAFAKLIFGFVMARSPRDRLPCVKLNKQQYEHFHDHDVLMTWLGHSTVLIKTGNKTILADPIFSKRASFLSFLGPKKFDTRIEYTLEDLPPIDVVVISHDHYDHLDYDTVIGLKDAVGLFLVPLGVKAHLLRWGVAADRVLALAWYEERMVDDLRFVFMPTRHFSGRSITDRMSTLWGAWIIKNGDRSIYFGGDSGYFDGFGKAGDQFGPFDVAFIECGAYNERWSQVHLFPEQTVQASIDLKASVLMPIHNSKFILSTHPWFEPLDRVLAESIRKNVVLATPKIGENFSLNPHIPQSRWWKGLR